MLEKDLDEMKIDICLLEALGFKSIKGENGDYKWLAKDNGIVEYCEGNYVVKYDIDNTPYDWEEIDFDIRNMDFEDIEYRYPEMEVIEYSGIGEYIDEEISLP